MMPRWSRLALAAILAFGVSPTALAAASSRGDDGRGRTTCPCERDGAGPSLVVGGAEDDLGGCPDRFSQPLCAVEAPGTCARVMAGVSSVETAAPAPAPARTEPTWRLAPKTSPPR